MGKEMFRVKEILQSQQLKNIFKKFKPWLLFIGFLFLLQETGALSHISYLTNATLMKTGAMDINPKIPNYADQRFDYNFTVKDLQGKNMEMSQLKGKVIFLNLWATWCGPCRVEMPSIQELYNSVDRDKVVFVMISLDQPAQYPKVLQYVKDKDFTFPVYLPDGSLPKLLQVNSIPATFIIGADGKVKSKTIGAANYNTEKFRTFLSSLGGGMQGR